MAGNNIYKKLLSIQRGLKVTKEKENKFKDKLQFKYRSCEDILEAVKPLLTENDASLILTDEIVEIGGCNYIKAIATFIDAENGETISTNAFAKEKLIKEREVTNSYGKKELKQNTTMGEEQLTGSASSYARKYALCGLFLLDDNKDPDSIEKDEEEQPKQVPKQEEKVKPILVDSKQVAEIMKGCSKFNIEVSKILETYKIKNLSELNQVQYLKLIKRFEEKENEIKEI